MANPKGVSPPTGKGETPAGISRGQWMALTAALLGWMFDGAEMGLFSMVGRPAIADLLGITNASPTRQEEATIGLWFGVVTAGFLVGAATGGVLFGWLGDRIGRVRAMTLSVFTYAFFTGLCGLAGEAWQVGALRFIAALGMGGEWSLGVALVMEVWPNRSRAFMAGLIGAAANVGYLLVGVIGLGMIGMLGEMGAWLTDIGLPEGWVKQLVANKGWRLMMILGTAPALLTFFIRLFVPESEKWQREKDKGGVSHWSGKDLCGVALGASGPALIIYLWADPDTTISYPVRIAGSLLGLAVATVGYTWPVLRFLQRRAAGDLKEAKAAGRSAPVAREKIIGRMLLAACFSGVALLGTWGSAQWAPTWADQLTRGAGRAKELTQIWSGVGAIVGTIGAALLGDWLGRRLAYFLLCLSSIGSVLILFQLNDHFGDGFLASAFLVGVCTASFYGWLPLYLPELFSTSMRATGQGFSFNFGRILAAIGALQTGTLMGQFKDNVHWFGVELKGGYPLACSVMSGIYLIGAVLIWFAPETRGKPLPD